MASSASGDHMVFNIFFEGEPISDDFNEDDDVPVNPKVEATVYLQAVIDGSANLAGPGVPVEQGRIYAAHKDDADMLTLFKAAAKAYSTYAVSEARATLAKSGTNSNP